MANDKMINRQLLKIYCESCREIFRLAKNYELATNSDTNRDYEDRLASSQLIHAQYRMLALQTAKELKDDKFLTKCGECEYATFLLLSA